MSGIIISPSYNAAGEIGTATNELEKRIHEAIWEDVLNRLCTGCQREVDCEAGYEPDSPVCAKHDAYCAIDESVRVLAYNIIHPVVRVETTEAA